MVTKIDRCSRNTLEFLKLQGILFKRITTFVALDLPNSIDLATNKLIATLSQVLSLKMLDEKNDRNKESSYSKRRQISRTQNFDSQS